MINIDYKITFQDDLDANETDLEYKFNLPWFKWGVVRGTSLSLLLLGLYYIIWESKEFTSSDANWIIATGIFFMTIGIAFPLLMQPKMTQSSFNRLNMPKRWRKKNNTEEIRNITLTEREFVFKTEYSESAWTWKGLKQVFEGSKGFQIWFYSGQKKYVPKRIFENNEEVERFKSILNKNN